MPTDSIHLIERLCPNWDGNRSFHISIWRARPNVCRTDKTFVLQLNVGARSPHTNTHAIDFWRSWRSTRGVYAYGIVICLQETQRQRDLISWLLEIYLTLTAAHRTSLLTQMSISISEEDNNTNMSSPYIRSYQKVIMHRHIRTHTKANQKKPCHWGRRRERDSLWLTALLPQTTSSVFSFAMHDTHSVQSTNKRSRAENKTKTKNT